MPPSWRLALNNLSGKRGRTALMIVAVGLASSLIVAMSCTIGSAQMSFSTALENILGAADVRIGHPSYEPLDVALLDRAAAWPGVTKVSGRMVGALTIARWSPDSRADDRMVVDAVGLDFAADRDFRTLPLVTGRQPSAADEILIDPQTAERFAVGPGDSVITKFAEVEQELRVVGVYERPQFASFQTPRIYIDRRLLGRLEGKPDVVHVIYLQLSDEVDIEQFCAAHAVDLPPAATIEPAAMVRAGFDARVEASRIGLIVGSAIAFIGAGFIIITGLTTGVTERQHAIAILRCIGASRSQICLSQLMTGAIFGMAGAIVGVPLGIAFSFILVTVYRESLPTGLVLHPLGITLALIGAVISGLLGATYPAFVASRVTPLRAMQQRAHPLGLRAILLCAGIGAALVAGQFIINEITSGEARFWSYVWSGISMLLIGAFLLAVPALILITAALAPLLATILRLPTDLLRGSVLRTPFRHGFLAGALMVGMSLLVASWSSGTSMMHNWIDRIRFPDAAVTRIPGAISEQEQQQIAALPGITAVCPIAVAQARVLDQQVFGVKSLSPNVTCVGVDLRTFFEMNVVEWVEGNAADAIAQAERGEGVIVAREFVIAKGFGIGSRFRIAIGRTPREVEIVGVIGAVGLDVATQIMGIGGGHTDLAVSTILMDRAQLAQQFGIRHARILLLNLAPDAIDHEIAAEIRSAIPGMVFQSGRDLKTLLRNLMLTLLSIQSTVAFASLILAAVAVGNVVAANIAARKFEYGVLRAVGAQPSVLARLILAETTIIAITGATVGLLLGGRLAAMDAENIRMLAGLPVQAAFPPLPLAIGFGVLIVITLIAAVPALRRLLRSPTIALLAGGR